MCNFNKDLNKRPPPFSSGMTVLSKGLAALDPATLDAMKAVPNNPVTPGAAPSGPGMLPPMPATGNFSGNSTLGP